MLESNTRHVQQKKVDDKSVYVTLPIKETGLYPGSVVSIEVVEEGKVVITRIKDVNKEKENSVVSYINKLLHKFGLHTHYELTKKSEINMVENNNPNNKACSSE